MTDDVRKSRNDEPSWLESRLPDEPAYWDALAERIVADATPLLRTYRAEAGAWWSALARRSPALAAAAGIAIAVMSFLVATAERLEPSPTAQVVRVIAPADPTVRRYLSLGTVPRVESLLPVLAREERNP